MPFQKIKCKTMEIKAALKFSTKKEMNLPVYQIVSIATQRKRTCSINFSVVLYILELGVVGSNVRAKEMQRNQ